MSRRIGLIGGAGVAATNTLNCMIEEHFTRLGAFRDAHHPEIISYQAVGVPSRSMYLEGRGESFVPGYREIGLRLKACGAEVLCMNCNTAHHAIQELQDAIGLPFINMIDAVACAASALRPGKRIGLMASDGCLLGRVYEPYFARHLPNIEIVYPDAAMQREVTRGICNIKNLSRFLPEGHADRPRTIFDKVGKHLVAGGAELIVSGCTDIAVDFLPTHFGAVPVIDSLSVLAAAIIAEHVLPISS